MGNDFGNVSSRPTDGAGQELAEWLRRGVMGVGKTGMAIMMPTTLPITHNAPLTIVDVSELTHARCHTTSTAGPWVG